MTPRTKGVDSLFALLRSHSQKPARLLSELENLCSETDLRRLIHQAERDSECWSSREISKILGEPGKSSLMFARAVNRLKDLKADRSVIPVFDLILESNPAASGRLEDRCRKPSETQN